MIRTVLLAATLAASAAGPVCAAERRLAIGSFDRVRIDGPFVVRIVTGRSPGGTIAGAPGAVEDVDLRVDGTTLVIQRGHGGWGERPRGAPDGPLSVTLGTPDLAGAIVIAGGTLSVSAMHGTRIDLSVTGAGTIAVEDARGDTLNAVVIGAGTITIGGRVGKARLVTNGSGSIDTGALDANDLVVRLDGPGSTRARARYTAAIDDVGLGRVTVAGNPKCAVSAPAGGPVTCGAPH